MFQRAISPQTVRFIIEKGKIIERYQEDTPYPSRLILGYDGERFIHVVAGYNEKSDTEHIVTVYEPTTTLWNEDFTKRR